MNLVFTLNDFDRGPLVGGPLHSGTFSHMDTSSVLLHKPRGVLNSSSLCAFLMFLLFRKQVSVLSNMMILAMGYCGKALQGRACYVCSQTHEREQACLSPGNQAVPFEATGNQPQEEASTLNWALGLSVWECRISL